MMCLDQGTGREVINRALAPCESCRKPRSGSCGLIGMKACRANYGDDRNPRAGKTAHSDERAERPEPSK